VGRYADQIRPRPDLTRPSGALGQAGDGGDQDRAEHKAHDADRGKDKTLPSGQAFAFGIIEERGEFLVDLDYWQQPGEAGAEAVFSQSAIPSDNTRDAVLQAFHILNAFDIPLGAVRASEDGGMIAEYTTWTSAADLKDLTWYFRTYHDQSIRSVELRAALAAANGRMRTIPMDSHQPVQDVSTSFK